MEWFAAVPLALLIIALGSIVVQTLRVGISPMPSSRAAVTAMLSLVPADASGEILELGAGWGSLALALAQHAPAARIIAWESSPAPYAVLWLRARLSRHKNLEVHFGDFARQSLTKAAHVVCYLWPGAMAVLGERFRRELQPGARVVSNTFGLRGWSPEAQLELDDVYRTRIYRYVR